MEAARGDSIPPLARILAGYNDGIARALACVESLRVTQETYEPTGGRPDRRATATLVYARGEPMKRLVRSSNLAYPAGDCTLGSLVGPALDTLGYTITVAGAETMEGVPCFRLDVVARVRDVDHFDGSVWVSTDALEPVRIVGEVADPPFPLREIRLDKTFEPVEKGLRLLRRHTGEVQAGAVLGRKRGLRHIFYEDYRVVLRSPDNDGPEK